MKPASGRLVRVAGAVDPVVAVVVVVVTAVVAAAAATAVATATRILTPAPFVVAVDTKKARCAA
jgi:type IV secretory pathway component VirB8